MPRLTHGDWQLTSALSLVAFVATKRHRAAKTLVRYLEPVVKQRLARRDDTGENNEAAPVSTVALDASRWADYWLISVFSHRRIVFNG